MKKETTRELIRTKSKIDQFILRSYSASLHQGHVTHDSLSDDVRSESPGKDEKFSLRTHKLYFIYMLSLPIKIKSIYSNPHWKIQPFLLLKRTVIGLGFTKYILQSFLTVISFVFWLWKPYANWFQKEFGLLGHFWCSSEIQNQ